MEQHEATKYVYCDCKCNYMLKDEAKHLEGPFHSLWLKMKTTPAPVSNTPRRQKKNRNAQITCECGLTYTLRNQARHKKDPRHISFFVPIVEAKPLNDYDAIEGDTRLEKWISFASEYNIPAAVSRALDIDESTFQRVDVNMNEIEDKAFYNREKGNTLYTIAYNIFLKSYIGIKPQIDFYKLTFEQQLEVFKQKSSRILANYNRKQGVFADILTLQLSNVDNEHSLSASFYDEHGHMLFPDTGIFLKENFPSIFEKKKFPF